MADPLIPAQPLRKLPDSIPRDTSSPASSAPVQLVKPVRPAVGSIIRMQSSGSDIPVGGAINNAKIFVIPANARRVSVAITNIGLNQVYIGGGEGNWPTPAKYIGIPLPAGETIEIEVTGEVSIDSLFASSIVFAEILSTESQ
jgi:hypothetical protein